MLAHVVLMCHYYERTAWAQVHGANCFTARWNWQGIAATAETRIPRDVAGQRLKVRFEIIDRRFGVLAGPVKEGEVDPNRVQRGPYTVYLTLKVCTPMLVDLLHEHAGWIMHHDALWNMSVHVEVCYFAARLVDVIFCAIFVASSKLLCTCLRYLDSVAWPFCRA